MLNCHAFGTMDSRSYVHIAQSWLHQLSDTTLTVAGRPMQILVDADTIGETKCPCSALKQPFCHRGLTGGSSQFCTSKK